MAPWVMWLVAFIFQILGILLIGDDIITARRRKASTNPPGHVKSMAGIGFLLAGLVVAIAA